MDFFRAQLQAAQASAAQLAQQVQDHSKILAQQAGDFSKVAGEKAAALQRVTSAKIQELKLPDSLKAPQFDKLGNSLTQPGETPPPSQAELEAYAITAEFRDFIRSLTYSTFRDFPTSNLPPLPAGDEKYLTPWQEQHAKLVCRSVSEINELRYVLCPKRMSDPQFWLVYFTLARKHLPSEAYDPDFVPKLLPEEADRVSSLPFSLGSDFQSRLQLGFAGMAKSLSGALPISGAAAPAADARGSAASNGEATGSSAQAESGPAQGGEDADLDAYLHRVMQGSIPEADDAENESTQQHAASSAEARAKLEDDEVDVNFDEYINELSLEGGKEGKVEQDAGDGVDRKSVEEQDSGEELDLDEYMKGLADEDDWETGEPGS